MKRIFRAIAITLTICVLALGAIVFAVEKLLDGKCDPVDQFLVVSIVSDDNQTRHAVTFKYGHANSSARVYAAWVLPEPRLIGSKEHMRRCNNTPAVIWQSEPGPNALRWSGGRLRLNVPPTAELMADKLYACIWEDGTNRLCFDSKLVDIESK